ncbi:NTP transferase domain-containing protein [Isachenkonia alkalipeptolytica]|uniref:Probable molybdenum cofactor guanylyltransferase n=1 Tax=Isachenkonia alkalipeptolytica TaxID=2565777 RepID=A0AA43XN40_9CLOT|nr:NTP transferase domain-containing protein [Isachenkonia alkalipeptolytica]NBG89602.1 Asp23/Gls24 family envelope stress response protein [Isachenkonia alkalipeptolytica]
MEKNTITPVILAGGANSRMGSNKALLEIDNQKIIEIMVEKLERIFHQKVHIVTNDPNIYGFLKDVCFLRDLIQTDKKNSLVGLYSGLAQIPTKQGFFLPCDMPFINESLIKHLGGLSKDYDVVVPKIKQYYQPLHGIYHKNCLIPMKKMIDRQHYKIIDFFPEVRVRTVDESTIHRFDPKEISFYNINRKEEYERAIIINQYLRRMDMEIMSKEGKIEISNEVIMTVIREAVKDVEGVISFSSGVSDSFAEVFSKKTSSKKGVKIQKGDEKIIINISVVIQLGIKIPEVIEKVQKRIKDMVQSMTDIPVEQVNVYIQDIEI